MGTVKGNMAMTHNGTIAKPGAPAGDGGNNVGFHVDREQIPEVIKELQRAMQALQQASVQARKHSHITPPGGDPKSQEAVAKMGPDLVKTYYQANQRDIANIQAMIDNLDAAMRQYDAQEDESSRSLQKKA